MKMEVKICEVCSFCGETGIICSFCLLPRLIPSTSLIDSQTCTKHPINPQVKTMVQHPPLLPGPMQWSRIVLLLLFWTSWFTLYSASRLLFLTCKPDVSFLLKTKWDKPKRHPVIVYYIKARTTTLPALQWPWPTPSLSSVPSSLLSATYILFSLLLTKPFPPIWLFITYRALLPALLR